MSVLSALLQVKTDTESVGHVRKMKAGCVSLGHLLGPTYQKEKISDCQGFSTPHNVHPAASGTDSPIPHVCPVSQGLPCAFTVCLCLWRFSFRWTKYEHSLVFLSVSLPSLHSTRASLGRITFGSVCPSGYLPFSDWGRRVFVFFFLSSFPFFLRQSLIL